MYCGFVPWLCVSVWVPFYSGRLVLETEGTLTEYALHIALAGYW
jgi:hypothetical protein